VARTACRAAKRSQEDLQVELDRANRISATLVSAARLLSVTLDLRQLELLQHARVQNTEYTNGMVLAAEVELDSRCVAREEGRI
jgi:hypothetical protein